VLYAEHLDGAGKGLFSASCENDLEGVVAKCKWGDYRPDSCLSGWVKVKNPAYSQLAGRREQFTRFRKLSVR
jgi:ATP-dependent DNA ligase